MAYQSLYRRYRPRTFSEIRGQPHVVTALVNAVAKDEVGHAYLFHGPRGTGKTTSARVLAKALNCTGRGEGTGDGVEPCGTCESCVAIEEGRSFDLHELDAASNNKVDDMRDLLHKVNLGTPGKVKVYILDEVHMLTPGAENALLKTLEEPPEHVVWVLATTEPHKVVDTIRSRCQVFELNLLGAEEMTDHVRWVAADAGLDVDEAAIEHVVAVGGGSVRDTLSALDRVVAAGGIVEIDTSTDRLLAALADRDVGGALAALGEALGRGRDPRTTGEAALSGLRDAFLTAMGAPTPRITPSERARADDLASRMSPAALTRALETLGGALVDMRQAPDPRVDLEVALVRLCRPDTDHSVDALLERLDRLEARLAGDASTPAPSPSPAPSPTPVASPPVANEPAAAPLPPPPAVPAADTTAPPPPARSGGPAAAARRALAGSAGGGAAPEPAGPAAEPTTPSAGAPPSPAGGAAAVPPPSPDPPEASPPPGFDDEPMPLEELRPRSPREVVALAGDHLGLGRDAVVARANELLGPTDGPRSDDELHRLWRTLVAEHRGESPSPSTPAAPPPAPIDEIAPDDPGPLPDEPGPPPDDPDDVDRIDLDDLVDAPTHADHIVDRLTEAFPGAELHVPEEPDR